MTSRIAAVVLLTASLAAARTDAPSTLPSLANLTRNSATRPADSVSKEPESKLPSPAELIARMKGAKDSGAAGERKPRVAYFDFGRPVVEKPADFSLFGNDDSTTLRAVLERLEKARQDKDLQGVLVTMGNAGLNMSQALEVRDALLALRAAGKRTFVYADAYDTHSYVVASGATDVCMLPGGEIMLPGVGLQTMFAKGLLDKIGVEADYEQIGEFKGADEEFIHTQPSPEMAGELNKLVDALYEQVITGIAKNRNLPRGEVEKIIDDALVSAPSARERGLVDHLVDVDGLRDLLGDQLGGKVELLHNYGEPPRESIDLSSPFAFFSLLTKKPEVSDRPAVAIVYAEGVIVDGAAGGGILNTGQNVGSEDIRQALRLAERDPKIGAVVIRIDSPGGSALASEAMWQAVRRVQKTKPVIISIGSMAASGGYYLASGGSYIFADPTAIVGSIGVVGGKFVLKDLFAKVGISTTSFQRGANAGLFDTTTPWSDQQRKMVHDWMHDTYVQFTERVMTTRKGKIQDIDKVARGRIFLAPQARDLGMVDALGGVEDAISYAAKQADYKPGAYDVRAVPAAKTLADFFGGGMAESKLPIQPNMSLAPDSVLNALPVATRQLIAQQIEVLQMLEARPVALVSPYLMSVK